MNFLTFMSSVPLREDILDDITYLQKHLRLIIKFHQVSCKLTQRSDEFQCLVDVSSSICVFVHLKVHSIENIDEFMVKLICKHCSGATFS